MVIDSLIGNKDTQDNHVEVAFVFNQITRKVTHKLQLPLLAKGYATSFALLRTKENSHWLKTQTIVATRPTSQLI